MLPNITEAIPMLELVETKNFYLCFLPWPLLSLAICCWQVRSSPRRLLWPWLLIGTVQLAAVLLSTFYESRFSLYAQLFGIVPITFGIQFGLSRSYGSNWSKAALVVLVPIFSLGIPLMLYTFSWIDIALFPMRAPVAPCDVADAAAILSRPPYYTGSSLIVLNTIDEGPELLLRTPHSVLSAPFHTDMGGNLDTAAFFKSTNLADAKNVLWHRHVSFVLSCRDVERGYLISPSDSYSAASKSLELPWPIPLILMLNETRHPDWLKPIDIQPPGRVMMFSVVPKRDGT